MMERLINLERPYGGPAYHKLSTEIGRLKELLSDQLEKPGQQWLEQMTDYYMQQETTVVCDAFAEGFWSAVEFMLEFQRREQAIHTVN